VKKGNYWWMVVVAIIAFPGLAWVLGGGYTAWRLSILDSGTDWNFVSLLVQWVMVILYDHFTQIILVAIAIAVFAWLGRPYTKRRPRRYIYSRFDRRWRTIVRW